MIDVNGESVLENTAILTSAACPICAAIKETFDKLATKYSEFLVDKFMAADYGVPREEDDIRFTIMVGLLWQNMQLPVVVIDGKYVDYTSIYDGECENGTCTYNGAPIAKE